MDNWTTLHILPRCLRHSALVCVCFVTSSSLAHARILRLELAVKRFLMRFVRSASVARVQARCHLLTLMMLLPAHDDIMML